jgi:hypothetical protein
MMIGIGWFHIFHLLCALAAARSVVAESVLVKQQLLILNCNV